MTCSITLPVSLVGLSCCGLCSSLLLCAAGGRPGLGSSKLFVSKSVGSHRGLCGSRWRRVEEREEQIRRSRWGIWHPRWLCLQDTVASEKESCGRPLDHMGGPLELYLLPVSLPQTPWRAHLGGWWDMYLQYLSLLACLVPPRPPTLHSQRPLLQEAKCQAPTALSPDQDGSLVESHPHVTGRGEGREHSLAGYSNTTKQLNPLIVSLLCLYPGAEKNSLQKPDREENTGALRSTNNRNVTLYE